MASDSFVVIYFPRHFFGSAYVSKFHLCRKEGKNFGLMHKSVARLRKNYKTFCYMFQSDPGANLEQAGASLELAWSQPGANRG